MVERAPDSVWARAALQHAEQSRLEALRSERDAVDACVAQEAGELRCDGLGIRLDGHLRRPRQGLEQPMQCEAVRERRRPAAEEDRLERAGEHSALEPELGKQRIDVTLVLPLASDNRHEVAVAAAVAAEWQVDVEVAN